MLRLGGRIAAALKDKLEFPWDDFKQTFAERAEKELGQRALPAVAEEDADAEPMQLRRCRARTTAQSTPALLCHVSLLSLRPMWTSARAARRAKNAFRGKMVKVDR